MEETKTIIQIDWMHVIIASGSIIMFLSSALLLLYKKLCRRLTFTEAWLHAIEYVFAKKDGNGAAKEIREMRKQKLEEWNYTNVEL